MKIRPAIALIAAGCAAPSAQPDLLARTVDGITVFERPGDGSGRLVVQDAVEWRGTFGVESKCLMLALDGEKHTPVFGNPAALQAALGEIRSGGTRSWSIQGSRAPGKDEAAYAKAMGACAKRPFLISALSDPGP